MCCVDRLRSPAEYIERSIQSAADQDHDDLEIIAVDDGSTDSSLDSLTELAKVHANLVVISQRNGGLSAARNTGMRAATGEYVLFHDGDDALEPDAISKLLKIALEQLSDVAGGVFRRHTEKKVGPVTALQHDDFAMDFQADIALANKYSTNFSSCNKLFRLQFLRGAGIEFTAGLYMQDIEFWLKCMFTSNNISQTRHFVSNYYFYPNSGSQAKTRGRFDSLFVLSSNLKEFFAQEHLKRHAYIGNHALMQGAFRFFAQWKLDEWGKSRDSADLDRIRSCLEAIPGEDFVSFLERNRGPTTAILLLIRERDYEEALRIRHSPYTGSIAWRRVYGHLNTTEKIISFARGAGKPQIRNAFYEVYYLAPYYLRDPKLLRTLPSKILRRKSENEPNMIFRWIGRVFYLPQLVVRTLRRGKNTLRWLPRAVIRKLLWIARLAKIRISVFLYNGVKALGYRGRAQGEISPAPAADPDAILDESPVDGSKKILIFGLGDLYSIGGVQLSYQRLFDHLCAKGHRIVFYSHRERLPGSTL